MLQDCDVGSNVGSHGECVCGRLTICSHGEFCRVDSAGAHACWAISCAEDPGDGGGGPYLAPGYPFANQVIPTCPAGWTCVQTPESDPPEQSCVQIPAWDPPEVVLPDLSTGPWRSKQKRGCYGVCRADAPSREPALDAATVAPIADFCPGETQMVACPPGHTGRVALECAAGTARVAASACTEIPKDRCGMFREACGIGA